MVPFLLQIDPPAASEVNLILIIVIMVASGLFGGITNYLVTEPLEPPLEKRRIWVALVSGVTAAFLVPLFLEMISSDLLYKTANAPINFLIFAGFCLIAAVYSRGFLQSISQKVIRQLEATRQTVRELKPTVEAMEAKTTEPIVEVPDPEMVPRSMEATSFSPEDRILSSLHDSRFTFRPPQRIAQDLQMPIEEVNQCINQLELKELIWKMASEEPGIPYKICLTKKGSVYIVHLHSSSNIS